MKFRKLALGTAAAALTVSSLAACNDGSQAYYDTICVNPITQTRMPDYYCQPTYYGYHPSWVYYVGNGGYVPGVGIHITHYSVNHYHRPSSGTIHTGGVPRTGGTARKYTGGNVNLTKAPKAKTGGYTGYTRKPSITHRIKTRIGRR